MTETPARRDIPLRTGDMLYGFCSGYFGRDSYSDKRVEAIGADWVVVRNEQDGIELFTGEPETLLPYREKPGDDWP